MPIEIEHKFLLRSDRWRERIVKTIPIQQGYLSSVKERTVRVRLKGEKGILTVKGESVGVSRPEFEYEIPVEEARLMMGLCEQPIIDKTRYEVVHEGHLWEIDVFAGENEGLVVAEIELEAEGEVFARPDWLGEEVSDDPRFFNSSLVSLPFCKW
ncbi:MAG: adenylate cyclase [Neolewinella sp.]|jgi:adenylate cyclase